MAAGRGRSCAGGGAQALPAASAAFRFGGAALSTLLADPITIWSAGAACWRRCSKAAACAPARKARRRSDAAAFAYRKARSTPFAKSTTRWSRSSAPISRPPS
jgi:hypothetical protein